MIQYHFRKQSQYQKWIKPIREVFGIHMENSCLDTFSMDDLIPKLNRILPFLNEEAHHLQDFYWKSKYRKKWGLTPWKIFIL